MVRGLRLRRKGCSEWEGKKVVEHLVAENENSATRVDSVGQNAASQFANCFVMSKPDVGMGTVVLW